jgi:hypothetical protein
MAIQTKPKAPHRTRAQVAEQLKGLLGEEPRTVVELSDALGFQRRDPSQAPTVVANALAVLAARDQAREVPAVSGSGARTGWVAASSHHQAQLPTPIEIEFDYEFVKSSPFSDWFVDHSYQRPLTAMVKRIARDFNPYLFGAPMLSERSGKAPNLAIIDGQTRWEGGRRFGVSAGPAQIFHGLSAEQEADIFWRTQKQRTGMVSFHRFRAQLRAGNPESIALAELCKYAGYELGDAPGQLRAMGALESAFRTDEFLLERVLTCYHEAWPEMVPEGSHITGLHFFFRHFPLEKHSNDEVNDERLVKRLRVTGPDGLARRASAAREIGTRGNSARFMATAIQAAYLSGGRS